MPKSLSLIVFLFLTAICTSQNKGILNDYAVLKGNVQLRNSTPNTDGIDGSPYYNDNEKFVKGRLYVKDNKMVDVDVRYNIVNEEMQVLVNQDNYQILKQEVKLAIGNTLFKKYRYINEEGKHFLGYFEVVSGENQDQPLILLKKLEKEVRGSERNRKRGIPPKFVDKSSFYLKFDDSFEAVFADSRTKDFLKAFQMAERESMEKYIDENKLKPKKEEDLEKIVKYYNKNFSKS